MSNQATRQRVSGNRGIGASRSDRTSRVTERDLAIAEAHEPADQVIPIHLARCPACCKPAPAALGQHSNQAAHLFLSRDLTGRAARKYRRPRRIAHKATDNVPRSGHIAGCAAGIDRGGTGQPGEPANLRTSGNRRRRAAVGDGHRAAKSNQRADVILARDLAADELEVGERAVSAVELAEEPYIVCRRAIDAQVLNFEAGGIEALHSGRIDRKPTEAAEPGCGIRCVDVRD